MEENFIGEEHTAGEFTKDNAPLVGDNSTTDVNLTEAQKEVHNSPPLEPKVNLEMDIPPNRTKKYMDDKKKDVNASGTDEKKDEETPINVEKKDENEKVSIGNKE